MRVIRSAELTPVEMEPGVTVWQMVGKEIGAKTLMSGVASFAAGASLLLHTHDCEETVTVISGEAICDAAGKSFRLKPHDTTFMPPGVPHRYRNASDSQPMMIAWTYPAVDVARDFVEEWPTPR